MAMETAWQGGRMTDLNEIAISWKILLTGAYHLCMTFTKDVYSLSISRGRCSKTL